MEGIAPGLTRARNTDFLIWGLSDQTHAPGLTPPRKPKIAALRKGPTTKPATPKSLMEGIAPGLTQARNTDFLIWGLSDQTHAPGLTPPRKATKPKGKETDEASPPTPQGAKDGPRYALWDRRSKANTPLKPSPPTPQGATKRSTLRSLGPRPKSKYPSEAFTPYPSRGNWTVHAALFGTETQGQKIL